MTIVYKRTEIASETPRLRFGETAETTEKSGVVYYALLERVLNTRPHFTVPRVDVWHACAAKACAVGAGAEVRQTSCLP